MVSGCASVPPASIQRLDPSSTQAIYVQTSKPHSHHARLALWEFEHGRWQKAYPTVSAVIGRNGLAPAGTKKEGDGRTPSGTYALGTAFGYFPSVQTGLDYRQTGPDDFWVDDPYSNQYNQWVKGTPKANSYEKLKRDDPLYKLGIVIEYNTKLVVPGAGSAIFMHIWRRYDQATAGCVAASERHLRHVLKRLDRSRHPVIIMEEYGQR